MSKSINDRVRYRVLQNPDSAPEKDYVADALVMEVLDLDMLLLLVLPRRSEPFQIGPVPHISDADMEVGHFHYWEEIPDTEAHDDAHP